MKNKNKNIFDKGREIAENISSRMLDVESDKTMEEWLTENEFSKEVVGKFTDAEKLTRLCEEFKRDKSAHVKRLAQEIEQRKKRRFVVRLVVATNVAAFIAIAFLLLNDISKETHPTIASNENRSTTILTSPQNAPLLILDNGVRVDLSKNKTLAETEAKVIGDSLKYNRGSVIANEDKPKYNTLLLPEKCAYFVTLSDGTNVYINANSTLKYPILFFGDSREVILNGEAYFEVQKDTKKPFVVISGETRIKVYGTKFNVNSYNPELIKTSLISGSVGVQIKGHDEVMIRPGQMLSANTVAGKSSITNVNTSKYEAWKQGFFRCDNEDISIILEDLSAWYGVQFEYEFKESRHTKISASIDRNLPIEEVIELLKVTSNVKFKKKGDKIYTIR